MACRRRGTRHIDLLDLFCWEQMGGRLARPDTGRIRHRPGVFRASQLQEPARHDAGGRRASPRGTAVRAPPRGASSCSGRTSFRSDQSPREGPLETASSACSIACTSRSSFRARRRTSRSASHAEAAEPWLRAPRLMRICRIVVKSRVPIPPGHLGYHLKSAGVPHRDVGRLHTHENEADWPLK